MYCNLTADMSAFKAANPDAVFEDFIRWHSPRDWENDESEENGASESSSWPPRGKLSDRMSDPGNSWRKIWNEAPAVPASEQKPLWDPNREGEKVLHLLIIIVSFFLLLFRQSCRFHFIDFFSHVGHLLPEIRFFITWRL